jgi:hypothetical protein
MAGAVTSVRLVVWLSLAIKGVLIRVPCRKGIICSRDCAAIIIPHFRVVNRILNIFAFFFCELGNRMAVLCEKDDELTITGVY